jgi:hypothetical protein
MQTDLHLDPLQVRGPEHIALDTAFTQLCRARRDPTQPALSPLPLLAALNPCLAMDNQPQFDIEQGSCAGEFLASVLEELALQPGYLVHTREEEVCQICGTN